METPTVPPALSEKPGTNEASRRVTKSSSPPESSMMPAISCGAAKLYSQIKPYVEDDTLTFVIWTGHFTNETHFISQVVLGRVESCQRLDFVYHTTKAMRGTYPAAPCTVSYIVATVPGPIGVPWGKETFDDTVVDLGQVGLSVWIP